MIWVMSNRVVLNWGGVRSCHLGNSWRLSGDIFDGHDFTILGRKERRQQMGSVLGL